MDDNELAESEVDAYLNKRVVITLHGGAVKKGVLSKVVVRVVGYKIGDNDPIPATEIQKIGLASPKKRGK
jgi:hypothetical protein